MLPNLPEAKFLKLLGPPSTSNKPVEASSGCLSIWVDTNSAISLWVLKSWSQTRVGLLKVRDEQDAGWGLHHSTWGKRQREPQADCGGSTGISRRKGLPFTLGNEKLVQRALDCLANDGCLAKLSDRYDLTVQAVDPLILDILEELLPYLRGHSLWLLGESGVGKTPLARIVSMMFSRYHGGCGQFRTAPEFDFFRGIFFFFFFDKATPAIFDDGEIGNEAIKKKKAFSDVGDSETILKERLETPRLFSVIEYSSLPQCLLFQTHNFTAGLVCSNYWACPSITWNFPCRWTAAKFVMHQLRIVVDNQYNPEAQKDEGISCFWSLTWDIYETCPTRRGVHCQCRRHGKSSREQLSWCSPRSSSTSVLLQRKPFQSSSCRGRTQLARTSWLPIASLLWATGSKVAHPQPTMQRWLHGKVNGWRNSFEDMMKSLLLMHVPLRLPARLRSSMRCWAQMVFLQRHLLMHPSLLLLPLLFLFLLLLCLGSWK